MNFLVHKGNKDKNLSGRIKYAANPSKIVISTVPYAVEVRLFWTMSKKRSKVRQFNEEKCMELISFLRTENWALIEDVAKLINDMAALNEKHREVSEKYGAFAKRYSKLAGLYQQTLKMFTDDGEDYRFPEPSPQ